MRARKSLIDGLFIDTVLAPNFIFHRWENGEKFGGLNSRKKCG